MKRISAFLCSVLLLLISLMSAMPAAHAVGSNLLTNPSVEDNVTAKPTGWASDKWGTNTTTFSYLNTGRTGTHSLNTKITARSSGDAKWYFTPITVSPNTSYTYSDWYQSTAASSIDVVVTTTANTTSYLYQGDQTASAAWKQATYTFTTPANAKQITVYHYLERVGSLTTDDYSLVNNAVTPTPPTAPTVSLTSPAAGSSVSGSISLAANASDAQSVSGVQFKVDGVNAGAEDTTSPYATTFDTKSVANGSHTVTATARNPGGLSTTATAAITVNNVASPTAPTVTLTSPTAGSTVSGTITAAANASDAQAVAGVQFKLDTVNLGTEDTTSPYTVNLDTTTVANGNHTITATARNSSGLTTTATVSFTVSNVVAPTAPAVSITAPAAGSTVSGTSTLTANASDAQSVTSVQFKVDGTNVGTADTTSPYSYSWDSKTVTDGTHTVTAIATNNSNLTTTSTSVSFTVSNPVTPPPATTNLLANPSVETGTTIPNSWSGDGWGTNTRTMTYETSGHTGTRSVKATISAYTSGDAKWMHTAVPVTANTTYNYSNWYMSNTATELDAMVTMTNGTVQYYYLTSAPAAATWTQLSAQFTAPVGAANVVIFQVIGHVGYLQTDDFSLLAYTPTKFNRALVSLTFDDGWRSIATNGLPLLKKYGLVSTQYLNSQPVIDAYPDYMTYQMIKDFAAQGSELAWHTRSHADLTTLSVSGIDTELNIPTAFLSGSGQAAAGYKNFATPYGAYNATSVTEIKKFYRSHRSTDVGYNSKDNFNIYNIKVQNIVNTTTPAEVQSWVNQAKATNTWLVLVYHEVNAGAADPTYAVTPANLDQELNLIKQSGVTVKTVDQALDELVPQL